MGIRQIAPLPGRRPRLPVIDASKLRVAQLTATPLFEAAKVFAPGSWCELAAFAPQVLLATTADYLRLIDRMSLHTVDAGAVSHAVFVITAIGDKPTTEQFRDLLWRSFRVPVYELYVDGRGALLAYDCEAQDGWHVEPACGLEIEGGELLLRSRGAQVRTGLSAAVDYNPCPCGITHPRVFCAPEKRTEVCEPALAVAS